jgi:uncharacterized membrane protein
VDQPVPIRSGRDRLRYTLIFEILLMAMLIPAGSLFFDKPFTEIGTLSIALALKATILNLIYNWVFDKFDAKAGRISSNRSTMGRLLHAFGFEASLTITSLPLYVWLINVTVLEALATDIFVTTFVVAYTYVFTLGYDKAFPVQPAMAPRGASH